MQTYSTRSRTEDTPNCEHCSLFLSCNFGFGTCSIQNIFFLLLLRSPNNKAPYLACREDLARSLRRRRSFGFKMVGKAAEGRAYYWPGVQSVEDLPRSLRRRRSRSVKNSGKEKRIREAQVSGGTGSFVYLLVGETLYTVVSPPFLCRPSYLIKTKSKRKRTKSDKVIRR